MHADFRRQVYSLELASLSYLCNNAHINELDIVLKVHENVGQLEILVDKLPCVHVAQCADELSNELAHETRRDYLPSPRVLIHQSVHIITYGLHGLEHSKRYTFVIVASMKHLNYMWMRAERLEYVDFVQETSDAICLRNDDCHLGLRLPHAFVDNFVCPSIDWPSSPVIRQTFCIRSCNFVSFTITMQTMTLHLTQAPAHALNSVWGAAQKKT
mmetsp:Transcript_26357/g.45846  ORF Transcript_26357/g.45846 Transcript_26357/m.45846 type:complete len:214 (+) Transcript_26357:995-1636(+)